MKRHVILLGPPASGKGTQAELLAERFGLPSASTGAMLRQERAAGSDLGLEAEKWTREGKLFPDDLAMRVVIHWLDDGRWDGFLLDGFPRTLGQAKAFDDALAEHSLKEDLLVLQLDLSEVAIRERVADRLTCRDCGATWGATFHKLNESMPCPACGGTLERRGDDTTEALDNRLAQYQDLTLPVCEFYKKSGRLIAIDASQSREKIHTAIIAAVEQGLPV